MSTRTTSARFHDGDQAETQPEFRIEIVYENPAAGVPALAVCEHLIEQLSGTFPLHVATHSFKALEAELEEAKLPRDGVDMIFVASAGAVPTALTKWLNEHLEHSHADAPAALVDMTLQQTPNADRIREFLKRAAETHHLELFSKEHFERPATFTSSSPRTVQCHSVRHWGINE